MKISFVCVLLLATLSAASQIPDYFASDPAWRLTSACQAGLPCIENTGYVYYIKGDSTIGNLTYQKLFKRGKSEFTWNASPPIPPSCTGSHVFNHFEALIRQDKRKVYVRDNQGTDTLLYDFDLQIGDSLPVTWNNQNIKGSIIVSGIDSILAGTDYRRIFQLSGNSSSTLVEGIGHNNGLLEPFPPILECGYNLECFALGDTVYFPNKGTPCDFTVSIPPAPPGSAGLHVFPNPARDHFTVQLSEAVKDPQVFAFDAIGRQTLLQASNIGRAELQMQIADLAKGIFLIRIISRAGVPLYVFTIIKN